MLMFKVHDNVFHGMISNSNIKFTQVSLRNEYIYIEVIKIYPTIIYLRGINSRRINFRDW